MKEQLTPVGGFQSGFSARIADRKHAKHPQFLICNHGCREIIQLVSHISGEVEFELCAIEAEKMAGVLYRAVRHLPQDIPLPHEKSSEEDQWHEIERKFLLPEFHERIVHPMKMSVITVKDIEQMYLVTGPEEVRIYRSRFPDGRTEYWHTVKVGLGLKRKEVDTEITEATYNGLRPRGGVPIYKTRTIFTYDGYEDVEMEMDLYDDGLRVMEVEFPNVAKANAFVPPSWFGKEVTEDPAYKNQSIWLRRQPAA